MPRTPRKPGQWTKTEEACLRRAYQRFRKDWDVWAQCADSVGSKTADQCRYYWREYCIPHLDRKSAWSLAEETLLEDHLRNNGETSWETVRELFPTRPYGYLHTKMRRIQGALIRRRQTASSNIPANARASSTPVRVSRRTSDRANPNSLSGTGAPDDTHEDEDDVVIVRHSPAPRDSEGPSAPTEVLERPSLSSTPSVSTSSRSPRSVMVLDAALAIFCTTGSQVQPAVRNRAQEILAKELFKNEARQIEIALVLFKSPTTCAHNRDLAQTVLVDHIDRFA